MRLRLLLDANLSPKRIGVALEQRVLVTRNAKDSPCSALALLHEAESRVSRR